MTGGPPCVWGALPGTTCVREAGQACPAPAVAAVCAFCTGLWAWVSACTRVQRCERALVVCASSLRVFRCTFVSLCPCVHSTAQLLSLRLRVYLFVGSASVAVCSWGVNPCVWRGELPVHLRVGTCVSVCACVNHCPLDWLSLCVFLSIGIRCVGCHAHWSVSPCVCVSVFVGVAV